MLIRDPIEKTVKKFGNLVSFYSVLQCAPGSNVTVIRVTSRQSKISFVVLNTSETYSDKIILFMLRIFDTIRESFPHEYIPEFEAMNNEELFHFQQCEQDENVTNRRKINLINERTCIQKLTSQLVDAIHPSRSRISHNIPIKIYGEGAIT